jgi:hypothetical protein
MGYYLLDHPNPNYVQTRPRTSWGWTKPTGLVTVHTAEGALDRIAPDTGAENVAGFIATRRDAGGYHVLVDTDSTINMAPDDVMTWHTAAGNLNGPGWGISAACRSAEWDPDAEWTRQIIARMGVAIRAFWERQGFDPVASARWLPGHVVLNAGGRVVGLTHHGDVQPGDRSDAWATHPRRAELDQMLVDAIVGAPVPAPEGDEIDMASIAELQQEFVNQDTRQRQYLDKRDYELKLFLLDVRDQLGTFVDERTDQIFDVLVETNAITKAHADEARAKLSPLPDVQVVEPTHESED